MLKIEGFAVPFGIENSWNETLAPDALDAFLEKQGNKPLNMGFMHEQKIGRWTKLEKRDGGLYVEGVVTLPAAERFIRANGMEGELSVTVRNNIDNPTLIEASNKRMQENLRRLGRPPAFVKLHSVEHMHVAKADLTEISLVDHGAFPGTWFKAIEV